MPTACERRRMSSSTTSEQRRLTPHPAEGSPAEQSPHWPKAAASAVVLRGDHVLLAQRGKGANAGSWSLPGGHIEPGETARDAATREVREECGLEFDIVGLADVQDVILHDQDGALRAHYLLTVFHGVSHAGEPIAASDCRAARFVQIEALAAYHLTPGAERVIRRAVSLVAGSIGGPGVAKPGERP